ncbi:hypothetical protein HGRIS_006080 [Hohenbuehelia grisea]
MLRYIDGRFAEGIEDERKASTGDRYVHLCIYFLDPDQIVPPAVPGLSAPLVPRARANSFSQPEPEPVILEPPVTTNPLLCRPTLPPAEIATIRRLSARVNVLPVIAKADILSTDRLAAVKMAVRRDLADAGIGFGIFDMDPAYPAPSADDQQLSAPSAAKPEPLNGFGAGHANGNPASASNTPPASPVAPLLRLPYALISPDIYSHSDGVPRTPLARHELVLQYTPSPNHLSSPKLIRGKYVRIYRWGSMDVLDPNHNDFIPLRAAIFHHMETLQKYTREYLFDKFRLDFQPQPRPTSRHSLHHHPLSGPISRPILAIDTQPVGRHPQLGMPRDMQQPHDQRGGLLPRSIPEILSSGQSKASGSTRSARQRTKKITVACNFCRSRKLKCDGGRPACSQCVKRSHPCDYMPQTKRRGNPRGGAAHKADDSESESGDDLDDGDRSLRGAEGDHDEASLSPEVPSQSLSRRSSNVDKIPYDGFAPSAGASSMSARDDQLPSALSLPSSLPSASSGRARAGMSISASVVGDSARSYFVDNELPHIATLSLPDPSPAPMSAPTLPAIRPASEQQAAQRKRAATVPGKGARQPTTSGPKVVACNFCRARKTKCDGAHPACSSCARRSLPCNYVHDSGPHRKGSRRASAAAKAQAAASAQATSHPDSPPSAQSSRMMPTPTGGQEYGGGNRHGGPREYDDDGDDGDTQSKRSADDMEVDAEASGGGMGRPMKKLRMDEEMPMAGTSGVA